jgi:hypothetical protein
MGGMMQVSLALYRKAGLFLKPSLHEKYPLAQFASKAALQDVLFQAILALLFRPTDAFMCQMRLKGAFCKKIKPFSQRKYRSGESGACHVRYR